ncbi:MAG: hypothetical protein ABW252_11550 [Polyangiales bacterium]
MGKRVRVNLTVRDGADWDAVTKSISGLGLAVEQQLRSVGVIVGEVDEGALEQLQKHADVASVERDRKIKIPPPDSPVQ